MQRKRQDSRSCAAATRSPDCGVNVIGFCLVGGGFIGPVHAANVVANPRARLRWVVDVDRAAADKLTGKFGGRATSDLDEALADDAVGAVMICTPPRTHGPIIERAARAGKAVFCEKPIDLDLSRVDACGRVLADTGTPFYVAFNRRFDPSHRALCDAIRAGDIGRTEMLVVSSRDPEISPPDYVAAMPFGIFYDTMIHDFDMLRWLTADEPVEIVAHTACMLDERTNPHRDPDTAMVMLRMAGGALVHVNSSFRAVYGYDQRIEAFGERGMLISQNRQPTTLERYGADGIRRDPLLRFFIERYAESYALELDAFIAAIEARRPPAIGFEDGRRALVIAEAAVTSAKSGAPVAIPR